MECVAGMYENVQSVQFSHSVESDSLQPHRLQDTRLSCPSPTPRASLNSCPSSCWCFVPCRPLLLQHQGLFKWVSYSHQVAKVLEFQIQYLSFHEYSGLISIRMDWLGWTLLYIPSQKMWTWDVAKETKKPVSQRKTNRCYKGEDMKNEK